MSEYPRIFDCLHDYCAKRTVKCADCDFYVAEKAGVTWPEWCQMTPEERTAVYLKARSARHGELSRNP